MMQLSICTRCRTGQVILTRNLRDFDLLNQILPDGHVLFYERDE